MNILVVDNCECLRSFCAFALEDQGHEVLQATESSYFDYILKSGSRFDLVTINANTTNPLPAKEVVTIIKSIDPKIPIILLTINWYNEVLEELINQGCEHLKIPFECDQFIEKVNSVCSLSLSK